MEKGIPHRSHACGDKFRPAEHGRFRTVSFRQNEELVLIPTLELGEYLECLLEGAPISPLMGTPDAPAVKVEKRLKGDAFRVYGCLCRFTDEHFAQAEFLEEMALFVFIQPGKGAAGAGLQHALVPVFYDALILTERT